MGRPRKKLTDSYKLSDGALPPNEVKEANESVSETPKKKYRNLAEIMGEDLDVDKTPDYKDYCLKLESMNKAELFEHSLKHNLLPHDNRAKMIDRLQKIWLKNNSKYRDVQYVNEVQMDTDKRKELKDILSPTRI